MALDPRTPVIVGVAQLVHRPGEPDPAPEPAAMMAKALRLAADDAGAPGLLRRIRSLRAVPPLSWSYRDPARLVADHLGLSPAETVLAAIGGNGPQTLVSDTCLAIARGDLDVAAVVGAEAMYTRRRYRKADEPIPWTKQDGAVAPTRTLGQDRPGNTPEEMARGLVMPINVYPVFENALRGAAGETIAGHQAKVGALWARFSEVAAANPFAWSPTALPADEIASPSPANRMIGFPYTKLMNANMQVDQASAAVLCSAEAAEAAGVPRDRWVFPWSGADAADHWWVSERADLCSSPAIRLAGRAALSLAGAGIDDVGHVDLYSCFPSAVQVAAAELGLALDDPARPLTLTGGLGFAGGPGNNYVGHSLAALVGRLRDDPDGTGLLTAVGWYLTKHAVGVYGGRPPAAGFRHADVQADVDALPRRDTVAGVDAGANLEAYTVMHDRDGTPEAGIVACLLDDGRRAWGTTGDADLLRALVTEDGIMGRRARLHAGGEVVIGG